jgi:hypothetical protein
MADQVRSRARRWLEPADQWRMKVQHWVDAGIVTSVQGQEILAMETSESEATAHVDVNESTLSPVVELASYLGIIVVGLSSVLFLGPYWSDLGVGGHVSVALMVTAAGLVGGFVVGQIGDAGARRLSGFLRLLGTGGAAMTTAIVVVHADVDRRGLSLLCVGVVVLALSGSLWRNLDRSLQFLSTILGLVLTVSALDIVGHLHPNSTEVALMVWLFAMAVGLMGLEMIRPARTALLVAEVGSFLGAAALSFPHHLGGVLLGLLSTLIAVAVGWALERPLIIVIGALGFFMFDFRIFSIYLRSANAALGAFILGLCLILIALTCARYATMRERSEVAPYTEVRAEAEWHETW